MSGPRDPLRRGFLRGLVTLPLIGGGVTLVGNPTAAAVPVTDELHMRYFTWLAHEHKAAMKEHAYRDCMARARSWPADERDYPAEAYARAGEEAAMYWGWFPPDPDIEALTKLTRPSTRAAVVLAAAGVPLVGGA